MCRDHVVNQLLHRNHPELPPAPRLVGHAISYSVTSVELLTNIAMLILPIPWLWKLYLPRSKKFALFGIFMLGSL